MERRLGCYVHVPFCASRCGYCDFNTYVPGEPGRGNHADWRASAVAEVRLARRTLLNDQRTLASVFVGGGTPTLLPPADLGAVITALAADFGLAPSAEITVEANPETVTPALLDELLAVGATRLSLGMQSADESVLRVLERQHTPGRAVTAVAQARAAGFERVSVDLIYGTPGESPESWADTVAAVVGTGVTHVSAYALKVEPGTRMSRLVGRGLLPAPDDDRCAEEYEIADDLLSEAGLHWYEISNWARPGHECQHNLGYWHGDDWWGIGPGAHSHVAGVRWWNQRHPARWSAALAAGGDPRAGQEALTDRERLTERVMLGIRLAEGLDLHGWSAALPAVAALGAEGLVERLGDRVVLTRRGRRLADLVTLRLLDALDPAA